MIKLKRRRGVAQLARVLAWGARGRQFKSGHSDHGKIPIRKPEECFILRAFLFKNQREFAYAAAVVAAGEAAAEADADAA